AVKDSNPWVRLAGVQGFARATTERPSLEERIGPLIADTNTQVAAAAALALLEPEVRTAAGLQWDLDYFRYQEFRAGSSESVGGNEERPLATLENKPPYLDQARRHLATTNDQERTIFALLLA